MLLDAAQNGASSTLYCGFPGKPCNCALLPANRAKAKSAKLAGKSASSGDVALRRSSGGMSLADILQDSHVLRQSGGGPVETEETEERGGERETEENDFGVQGPTLAELMGDPSPELPPTPSISSSPPSLAPKTRKVRQSSVVSKVVQGGGLKDDLAAAYNGEGPGGEGAEGAGRVNGCLFHAMSLVLEKREPVDGWGGGGGGGGGRAGGAQGSAP